MYRKMGARRRGHFLRALAVCGNATLAAERARVSRSWVYKERSANAKFDLECRAAASAADARLRSIRWSDTMPKGWSRAAGSKLVIRESKRDSRFRGNDGEAQATGEPISSAAAR